MSRPRRYYSPAFKLQAIQLLCGGATVRQVAAEFDVPPRRLQSWLRTFAQRNAAGDQGGAPLYHGLATDERKSIESLLRLPVAQRKTVGQIIQAFATANLKQNM